VCEQDRRYDPSQHQYVLLFTKARIILARAIVSFTEQGDCTVKQNFHSIRSGAP